MCAPPLVLSLRHPNLVLQRVHLILSIFQMLFPFPHPEMPGHGRRRVADKRVFLAAVLPHSFSSSYKIAEEAIVYAAMSVKGMSMEEIAEDDKKGKADGAGKVGNLVMAMSRGLRAKKKVTRTRAAEGLRRRVSKSAT